MKTYIYLVLGALGILLLFSINPLIMAACIYGLMAVANTMFDTHLYAPFWQLFLASFMLLVLKNALFGRSEK